jgi:hypothetical protein
MGLKNMISLAKKLAYTLEKGDLGDAQGRVSRRAVAEYQAPTSPRMRVRHFNIAGVAWSNFKPGINTNGRKVIFNVSVTLSIDVVNVGAGVDEALVQLKDEGGERSGRAVTRGGPLGREGGVERGREKGSAFALTTCLPGAA